MNTIMYVYIFLVFLSFFELLSTNKYIKFFLKIFASSAIIFVLGFGYKIGVDWVAYSDQYYDTSLDYSFEIFYIYLTKIFSPFISFWTFAILIKLIYISLLVFIINKYSKYPVVVMTIFFALSYAFVNEPLRQLFAASIFFLMIYFKEKYPNVFTILLSSLFHNSAILLLVGKIKLLPNNISIKSLFFVILGSFSFSIILQNTSFINVISSILGSASEKLTFYATYANFANIFSSIFRIAILTLAVILGIKDIVLAKFNNQSLVWRNSLLQLAFLMLIIEIISIGLPILGQRTRLYLLPFSLILLINGIYQKRILYKVSLLFVILLYSGLSLYMFLHGSMGMYYSLDMNLIIQYMKGFPLTNWESDAYNFWRNL